MHESISLLLLILNAPWTVLSHPSNQHQQPLTQAKSPVHVDIPSVGLGLWNTNASNATKAVTYAFKAGYTQLDSAAAYSNEQYVGKAINNSHAPARESYWITSKLWNAMHQPANVPKALNQTLSDLNTTYLDLWLMHWPIAFLPNQGSRTVVDPNTSIEDTWKAMEKLVAKNKTHPEPGTARYIGISNFSPRQIDDLLAIASVKPYAHEFELHPYLQQQQFVDWHHRNNITVIAYSPLANSNPYYNNKNKRLGKILHDPFWKNMSEVKGVSVAQAILGWGVARGTVVIPKSTSEKHIRENLASKDVTYTNEELALIGKQDKKARMNDPSDEWGVKLFESLDGATNSIAQVPQSELR